MNPEVFAVPEVVEGEIYNRMVDDVKTLRDCPANDYFRISIVDRGKYR